MIPENSNRQPSQNPTTTVVVLSYNSKGLLEQIIPKLISCTPTLENVKILIADNHSNDDSVAFLKSEFPQIQLVVFKENYGFAGGFNKAIELVETDFFVPLSCDVEVSDGWLDPLVQSLKENPGLGICQPTIRSRKRQQEFEYAGAAGGLIDALGIPFCRGRIFDAVEVDVDQYASNQDLFWAGGCCFIIRTDLFRKVGGFDPDFFAHMEEIDLCWRAQRAGYKVGISAESKVFHEGGATLDYSDPRKLFLNYQNNYSMLFKNLPLGWLILVLITRIQLDQIGSIYFLITRGFGSFWAVIKAQLSFIFNLPSLFIKRKSLSKTLPFIRPVGVFRGSIILQYFLFGVKKFTDLPNKFN